MASINDERLIQIIDLCHFVKKVLNYHEHGCACADECDQITQECAENPQCTGEFLDQAVDELRGVALDLFEWAVEQRNGIK